MQPKLISLQVGLPQTIPDPSGEWTSGIWKFPQDGPVFASFTGLAGDGQGDLVAHGGPDKAVYAYPEAHYARWRAELSQPELPYGGFGENLTVGQWTENDVCIGDIIRIGDELVVQVSQPRGPCWKLARRLEVKDIVARVIQTGYTGWYSRILQEGHAAAGMELVLLERPYPGIPITLANDGMWNPETERAQVQRLIDCPVLAESWRKGLLKRMQSKEEEG
jgi:MOSC domain-containing protein YiiM